MRCQQRRRIRPRHNRSDSRRGMLSRCSQAQSLAYVSEAEQTSEGCLPEARLKPQSANIRWSASRFQQVFSLTRMYAAVYNPA